MQYSVNIDINNSQENKLGIKSLFGPVINLPFKINLFLEGHILYTSVKVSII